MLVLIADDNLDSRKLVTEIIQSMRVDVVTAADGQEALEKVQQHRPDLVILDVNMPLVSGFEVVERMKADPATQAIPVIMLTALGDIEYRVHGLKLGADDYLSKPFSPRELIERVRTRLRVKGETDELRKTQQIIRDTFERYVAPSVVDQMLRNPTEVKLGGKMQEVTVMFSDLQGFTSISEHTDPELLLTILNAYHTLLVNVIRDHGGTVDKFMGDGVMALYNAPLEQPDHALAAVQTALSIRSRLSQFVEQFAPEHRMRINFGIHTGPAVVGNVGAPDLMNYTAVGDTVNLAARLQQVCTDGRIFISAATQQRVIGRVITQPIGELKVKGRVETVPTFEALALE
ncbi:MAG: adenylate/guanylate cyclase domain-containing protein [Candidatus Flexifilum sp.]